MVRDAEARGGGPLRRGNALPPETPDDSAQPPVAPDDAPVDARQLPLTAPAPSTPPVPGTRAAAAAAWAAASAATPPTGTPRVVSPAGPVSRPPAAPAAPSIPGPPSAVWSEPQSPGTPDADARPAAKAVPPAVPPVPTPAPATPAATPAAPTPTPTPTPAAPAPALANGVPQSQTPGLPPTPPLPTTTAPTAPNAAAAESASSASSRRQQREQGVGRRSFLQEERREEPARQGGRGLLNRVGFSLGPNARERGVRDDEHAVSRHWPGPRTVAVVNGKGGAGKTPATVLLSAVFAQYGGAGVLAWDNNQTRGTLGWRTETGSHDRTLLELLPQTQRLLGAQGQSADLAHFVHHQPQEKYDVLRSKPIRLAHENRLRPADVDSIHAIAAKFYRLIIIDSGNDESDPMWLRMIDLADQIVVATTTRDDHAEAGALLLEALEDRDERSARLARESVVVVSQADPKASPAEVTDVIAGYQPLAREVVGIPFDREMVDGHLRLRALAAPTQRSWLSAAAAVARGF
ncbi:AAA family ATPase [Microbacterium sp. WCS2018Hpa-9]|uniref:MinD/ParA family ATP-binding protein n=1 Tax=Microbacterium sp. WCS2018Hpa-9 TaxID=3073635 RepID=UPI002888FFC0|nr:AAA family ATPase [Microbacterium sp. WCS2018Hpa-9]